MLLTDLLTPERIKIPLVSSDKDELLEELVDLAATSDMIFDADSVLHAVREREEVLSTGIGSGVAIPHGKSDGVRELVLAAGITKEPIDFEALDGQPVQLLFLLVGPEAAAGQHVKALSRVSRMLRRETFRERLINAASADEFFAIISEAEAL